MEGFNTPENKMFHRSPTRVVSIGVFTVQSEGPENLEKTLSLTVTTERMGNPWGSNFLKHNRNTIGQFEDSFILDGRLPDSQYYLECLERKLEKLKRRRGRDKELLEALSKTKQSHLERIVKSDSSLVLNDPDLDQPVVSTSLHRLIAPEKQANTICELFQLIKYDQLSLLFEQIKKEKEP